MPPSSAEFHRPGKRWRAHLAAYYGGEHSNGPSLGVVLDLIDAGHAALREFGELPLDELESTPSDDLAAAASAVHDLLLAVRRFTLVFALIAGAEAGQARQEFTLTAAQTQNFRNLMQSISQVASLLYDDLHLPISRTRLLVATLDTPSQTGRDRLAAFTQPVHRATDELTRTSSAVARDSDVSGRLDLSIRASTSFLGACVLVLRGIVHELSDLQEVMSWEQQRRSRSSGSSGQSRWRPMLQAYFDLGLARRDTVRLRRVIDRYDRRYGTPPEIESRSGHSNLRP